MKEQLLDAGINEAIADEILSRGTIQSILLEKDSQDVPLKLYGGIDLYIDSSWYYQYPDLCKKLIGHIASNTRKRSFDVFHPVFIDSDLINAICNNTYIKELCLGSKTNPYKLSKINFEMLKSSGIKEVTVEDLDEELYGVFDPIIKCEKRDKKKFIGIYTFEKISSGGQIIITNELSDEELENLKYIQSNNTITIEDNGLKSLEAICRILNKFQLKNTIYIKCKDKKAMDDILLNNDIKHETIYIKFIDKMLDLKTYIECEKMLDLMIDEAKNLSPFEKYIYAYNITKKFKNYKDDPNSNDNSRNIYKILKNEYIVCFGFSNLFSTLLTRLGINNIVLNLEVDTSYDKVNGHVELDSPIVVSYAGHSRVYSYINDPKYGIDGFHYGDPTWDNYLSEDYYNHLAFTDNQVSNSNRYVKLDWRKEAFNVENYQEFYKIINIYIDRGNNVQEILTYILNIIKKLDPKYFNFIKEHYSIDSMLNVKRDNIFEILTELGHYISKKVNKPISGETVFKAVRYMYKALNIYPDFTYEDEMNNMELSNKERESIVFPYGPSKF